MDKQVSFCLAAWQGHFRLLQHLLGRGTDCSKCFLLESWINSAELVVSCVDSYIQVIQLNLDMDIPGWAWHTYETPEYSYSIQ